MSNLSQVFYLMTFPIISMFFYDTSHTHDSSNWVSTIVPLSYLKPILLLWTISTFGAVNIYFNRIFRILYSTSLFFIIALTNGRDFNHDLFIWLYISIILIFEIRTKKKNIDIIDLSKLVIVLTYFMSGFWKIFYSLQALFTNDIGYFHLAGLRQIILNYNSSINYGFDLLNLIPDFILFSVGILLIILELLGLLFYFRKRSALYFWGLAMIAFHLFTVITMKIEFVSNIVLIGLFICSNLSKKQKASNQSSHLYTAR